MMANRKIVGIVMALLASLGLLIIWGPTAPRRVFAKENQAARAMDKREIHVSPIELAHLLHNRQLFLRLVDLRDETAFNTFHLVDAKRWLPTEETLRALKTVSPKTVTILLDEDESIANRAYLKAVGIGLTQIYVLEGGMRAWLNQFLPQSERTDLLLGALGDRHPASYPSVVGLPAFVPKVKLAGASGKKSAGCGG
jgi:rhodanese-related sulfurtransferase